MPKAKLSLFIALRTILVFKEKPLKIINCLLNNQYSGFSKYLFILRWSIILSQSTVYTPNKFNVKQLFDQIHFVRCIFSERVCYNDL